MQRIPRIARVPALVTLALVALAVGWRTYEAAAMARPAPAATAPPYALPGPRAVGVRTVATSAPARLPLTVWYPALADDPAPRTTSYRYELKWFVRLGRVARVAGRARWNARFDPAAAAAPVVVLSPGFAMPTTAYAWLAERLASHGFVVVAPEHRELMTTTLDGLWRGMVTRPADVRAAIDWARREAAPGGRWSGVMDASRVAVVGHSLGGYTALASGGARLSSRAVADTCARASAEASGSAWLCRLVADHLAAMAALAGLAAVPADLWPTAGDPRVSAVVSLAGDAFLFGGDGLASVTVPVLALGGTADTGTPYAWGTEPTYRHVASARRARAAFEGAEHMIFAASCGAVPLLGLVGRGTLCGDPSWDVERAHDAVAHLTVAFLLAELADDADARSALAVPAVSLPGVTYAATGY